MHVIADHEFLKHENGDLALLINVVTFEEASDPILLVSKFEDKAYLHRAQDDVHEITGINPDIIDAVRQADHVVVLEMLGDKIQFSYPVLTAILEDDDDEGEEGTDDATEPPDKNLIPDP